MSSWYLGGPWASSIECSKSPFCETPVSSHDDDGADGAADNGGDDDDGDGRDDGDDCGDDGNGVYGDGDDDDNHNDGHNGHDDGDGDDDDGHDSDDDNNVDDSLFPDFFSVSVFALTYSIETLLFHMCLFHCPSLASQI